MTDNVMQNQNLSSIKVSKGMANKYAYDIKIYYKNTENYEDVIKQIEDIENKLKAKYGSVE